MDALIEAALQARRHAHAPFSKFLVGAALQADDGSVYTGCNIENASFGLTMCAERVAIFKAVSEGARRFVRMAVAADTEALTPPCGPCRQLLWEFCRDIPVTLVNLSGRTATYSVSDLLPKPFDATYLE